MIHSALILLFLAATGGPLAAQSATGRWSLIIHGPTGTEFGDLRIDSTGGRLLLETHDSAWADLKDFRQHGDSLAWRIEAPELEFTGRFTAGRIEGVVHETDGFRSGFQATPIQAGTDRWPVRPRITVRQLVLGSDATAAVFPDGWAGRMVPRATLIAEHAALARDAGLPPADLATIVWRAQDVVLGFNKAGRNAVLKQFERIAASPAADAEFQGLFRSASGQWRLDLHDAAWDLATRQIGLLDIDAIAGYLTEAEVLPSANVDTLLVRRAIWQLHGRVSLNRGMTLPPRAPDDPGLRGVQALMTGYGDAAAWWQSAVTWLMTHDWLETDSGLTSPVALMRHFWQDSTLTLPAIEQIHFGAMQAVPVVGAGRLGDMLLRGDNASGREWLLTADAASQAFDVWRQMEFGSGSTLPVVVGDRTMVLRSPALVTRSRMGGFLAANDAIRIEPAIGPLFAIGTLIHEWHHLLFEAARMSDPLNGAVVEADWGVRLQESDPWLAEGGAEWATEEVLSPARRAQPLFSLMEAEKRLSIGSARPDDTHVLGYLLVRVASHRVADSNELRRLLIAHLHEPEQLARSLGLDSDEGIKVPRPNTLIVIPEVTFIFDAGAADSPSRRLLFPETLPEM